MGALGDVRPVLPEPVPIRKDCRQTAPDRAKTVGRGIGVQLFFVCLE